MIIRFTRLTVIIPLIGCMVLLQPGCQRKISSEDSPGPILERQLPRARPSTVLLISLDTLRADRLSSYGYPKWVSPVLDRLAKESVVFLDHHSQATTTLPSHSSLFTSQYPNALGVFSDERSPPIPSNHQTLSEYMKSLGFRTMAFTGGGFVDKRYGFERGVDFLDQDDYLPHKITRLLEELDYFAERPSYLRRVLAADSEDSGISDNALMEPGLFVFFHTYHVHTPYEFQARYRTLLENPQAYTRFLTDLHTIIAKYKKHKQVSFAELPTEEAISLFVARHLRSTDFPTQADLDNFEFVMEHAEEILASWPQNPNYEEQLRLLSGCYDIAIRSIDAALGEVFDRLKRHGFWDEALVVVLSDHGEEFMEHKLLGHNQEYYYQSLIHVPLLIKYPRSWQIPAGLVAARTTNLDVLPTIAEVCDFALAGVQGTSLVQVSRRTAPVLISNEIVISEAFDLKEAAPIVMVKQGWYKATRDQHGKYVLFDLERDPLEGHDLAQEQPEVLARFRTLVEDHCQAVAALKQQAAYEHRPQDSNVGGPWSKPDPDLEERLRRLGYIK